MFEQARAEGLGADAYQDLCEQLNQLTGPATGSPNTDATRVLPPPSRAPGDQRDQPDDDMDLADLMEDPTMVAATLTEATTGPPELDNPRERPGASPRSSETPIAADETLNQVRSPTSDGRSVTNAPTGSPTPAGGSADWTESPAARLGSPSDPTDAALTAPRPTSSRSRAPENRNDNGDRSPPIPTSQDSPDSEPGLIENGPLRTSVLGQGRSREFREGDLLRGRFQLISKLGEGGMGAVWKGLDKLKQEARDRNPYVAIKLLQGDFREHPEAFIALQRETSKQQRLAHPNIATVYDFDRDDATNTVFMTMEVLEGQPLDVFVRRLPARGLSEEQAMPLIEQLCNGLAHAHSHGLVHSDFKPGNCFLTDEGNIKLLDFGIARASKTKTDAEGDTTLFDPAELGALTPTYATVEMFNGEDPDPRDDVYALGVMSYQLLTGRHPYGRRSAPKALELKLRPEPVPKLSKSQNRALARSVALKREQRTESVEQFFAELQPEKSRGPLLAAAGLILALIGLGAMYPVASDWWFARQDAQTVALISQPGIDNIRAGLSRVEALGGERQAQLLRSLAVQDAIVKHIARGDPLSVHEGLDAITPFNAAFRDQILHREAARKAVFDLYQSRIYAVFDPTEKHYDYPSAAKLMARLDALYPDSAQVFELRSALESEKKAVLSSLGELYEHHLQAGWLIANDREEDISDVLNIVRQIDPAHRLLTDPRLAFAFAREAESAIAAHDYPLANAFLQASTTYAPNDKRLKDLQFQVGAQMKRIENERRVTEIDARLDDKVETLKSLNDFSSVRDDLVVLSILAPENATLADLRTALEKVFGADMTQRIAARQWAEGENTLATFARLLDLPYLLAQRARLSEAQAKAGYSLPPNSSRKQAIGERRKQIDQLLASPKFTIDWEIALRVPYQELIALLPAGDETLAPVQRTISALYLQQAELARNAGSFSEALAFVEQGRSFVPELPAFDAQAEAIKATRERARLARLEQQRRARIAILKAKFRERTDDDDIDGAKALMAELETETLAADDDFLTVLAPDLLSDAYHRQATRLSRAGEFTNALRLARAAYDLAPEKDRLLEAVQMLQTEVDRRQLQAELYRRFDSIEPLDADAIKSDLHRLENEFPNEYTSMRERFAGARLHRILQLAETPHGSLKATAARLTELRNILPEVSAKDTKRIVDAAAERIRESPHESIADIKALSEPLSYLKSLSPQRYQRISQQLGEELAQRIRKRAAIDTGTAFDLWQAVRQSIPDSDAILDISIEPPMPEIDVAHNAIAQGKLTKAQSALDRARKRYAKHSKIPGIQAKLTKAKSTTLIAYRSYEQRARVSVKTSEQRKFDAQYDQIKRRWSDRKPPLKRVVIKGLAKGQCHPSLAGYGKKRGCYDRVAHHKGPELVVVPPGGGNSKAFAIGKYEVSVADFNHYCDKTKQCSTASKNTRVPRTNITSDQARAYARWLSDEASKHGKRVIYRLPTNQEWEHAAQASGKQPAKHFNCTVTSTSGQKMTGHALVSARAGTANGWGLTNYVGNAQEWVTTGQGLSARGGNFEDPLDECDLSINRRHSGAADQITGFRLVRELG